MKIHPNQSAFPAKNWDKTGMDIRTYLAGKAMQGLLTIFNDTEQNAIVPNEDNVKYMAILSVKAADSLINELNKTDQ